MCIQHPILKVLLSISKPLHLPRPVNPMHPREPGPNELLSLRLQDRSLQIEVIDRPDPQEVLALETTGDAIHDTPADGAEERGHVVTSAGGIIAGIASQFVSAADPFDIFVGDDEVGGSWRRGDFVAVGAIAGEGVDDAVDGECKLDCTAEAGSSCLLVVGVPVGTERNVGSHCSLFLVFLIN